MEEAYNNMKLTNQTLLWIAAAVIVLLITVVGISIMTLGVGQPFYVYGQPVGFNADAFEKLQARLDESESRYSALATESASRLAALQLEIAEWKGRNQNHEAETRSILQKTWFPVADVRFEVGRRNVWRHPDSELTLAAETITARPTELLIRTNLPAPGNKLRFSANENQWVVSMNHWRYRLTALELDDESPVIRVERQSKLEP